MKGKLIKVVIILTIILGIASFWYYQRNIYSKESLRVEILGTEEAEMAQEIEYIVKYKNNGNIRLEEPKLIFEYPKNSIVIGEEIRSENQEALPQEEVSLRQEKELEDIYPGQERTFHFKARLLGRENEAKIAKVWLSYKPKNLKTRYESATTFTTLIKSVPLTFEFDFPSKVEPGKKTLFRLNYFSNIDYPISNLRIKIEYPSGFEFFESQPKALGKTEWEIPLLNKAGGGRIEVSGILRGEVQESKIFRANLGIWQEGEFVLLKETIKGIEITRPSIFVSYQINNSPQYVANPGDYLYYEIFFKNTGEEVLENLFLVVQLEGGVLDFNTLQAGVGQFQKDSNSIIWDHIVFPQLRLLDSMEEGKVGFWVKVKDDLPIKNPLIRTKVSLSQVKEEFITKINTKLAISQEGYFNKGAFKNYGLLPPRVGSATAYTIFWQAKNFYNDVKNLKVKANLPLQVRLTGEISSKEAKFSFDPTSREIVWEIGELAAGKGILGPGPEISFQVALTPDLTQRGEIPELISRVRIIGDDIWTREEVEAIAGAVNTSLPDDPTITEEMGQVQ
ncbi:MAG: hypothetical protein ACKKMS_01870 [Candidatus Nealsonbacteria bacterium]